MSVTSYADDRLSTILNAHAASQIVSETLADPRSLEAVAKVSYTHSNGFDKITLVSSSAPEFKLRLHAWWPRSAAGSHREFIHSHRWPFRSTMLCGRAHVETFTQREDGALMYRHVYRPRDAISETYQLQVAGETRLASDLMFSLAPGSTYSMGPDLLHRVLWGADELSISMFVRWGSIRPSASVFAQSEIDDAEMLSVPSFTTDQLREKLERILSKLTV